MAVKKTFSTTKEWMDVMGEWFNKLPPLSKGGKDAIVNITPWVALVFGVLGILASLAGFGILTALSPLVMLGGGISAAGTNILQALIGIVGSVLLLLAFPGTKAKKINGWNMLFYSEVVNTLSAVIAVNLTGIIISLISFYILFQIKEYYK